MVKVNFLADGRCFFGAEYFRLFGESFNIIRLAHNYYGIYYGIRGLGSRLVASVLRQRYVETAEKDTDYIRNTAWVFTAANGLRLWRQPRDFGPVVVRYYLQFGDTPAEMPSMLYEVPRASKSIEKLGFRTDYFRASSTGTDQIPLFGS